MAVISWAPPVTHSKHFTSRVGIERSKCVHMADVSPPISECPLLVAPSPTENYPYSVIRQITYHYPPKATLNSSLLGKRVCGDVWHARVGLSQTFISCGKRRVSRFLVDREPLRAPPQRVKGSQGKGSSTLLTSRTGTFVLHKLQRNRSNAGTFSAAQNQVNSAGVSSGPEMRHDDVSIKEEQWDGNDCLEMFHMMFWD